MLRVAICDDDNIIIEELDRLLRWYGKKHDLSFDIQHFISGEALLEVGTKQPFNFILLDVEMNGMNGIETAKTLRAAEQKRCVIIFITGLESYMQDAFDVRAFHCLVKPVKSERFYEVLRAAISEEEYMSGRDDAFMMVSHGGIYHKIPLRDIIYIDCYNKKATIHTSGREIGFYGNMKDIENQLDDSFFRCHRSVIVNLRYVSEYNASDLRLTSGGDLPIARHQYSGFVKAFMLFLKKGGDINY